MLINHLITNKNNKNNLKNSFFEAKEHILALENEIFSLKDVILMQNNVIKQLSEQLINLSNNLKNLEKTPNQPISTGSEGVNQSINHLINQSISTKSQNQEDLDQSEPNFDLNLSNFNLSETIPEEPPKKQFIVDKNEILPPKSLTNFEIKSENLQKKEDFEINLGTRTKKKPFEVLDKAISSLQTNINKTFSSLSKQELRVFLTLYQLDEELNGVSYTELSSKLSLTEPCIRGYISTLMKKSLPILRSKLNNKRTILTISKDFKSLDLKHKLISLYYESDPKQTTLFDLKL